MLQAIIFDMDGVLIDSETTYYLIMKEMLKELGYELSMEEFLGGCGIQMKEVWPRLGRITGLDFDPSAMLAEYLRRNQEYLEEHGQPEFDGTRELLKAFKEQGYRLAVASASLYETVLSNMQQLGYAEYFDEIISSQSCERGKPEPDVFLTAAKRLGVKPENCMVVEDSRNGMIAAERAGMKWVGFCGAQIPTDMSHAKITFSDYRNVRPGNFEEWYEIL